MKHTTLFLIIATISFIFQSCTYTERITDGKTAYERKQFAVAIPMFEKEYKKEKDINEKGRIAYQLAESYRKVNDPQNASDWYRKAQENRYGKDTDLKYAEMLLQLQDYPEAKQAFRSAGRYAGDARMYREQMYACDAAQRWLKEADSSEYKVSSLATNNTATDFSPVVYGPNQLIISSDRVEEDEKEDYKWTGEKFFDLYLLDIESNTVTSFEQEKLDDAYHQGNLVFTTDKKAVFFTECGSDSKAKFDYCKIMYSKIDAAGNWSTPVQITLGPKAQNYMHPTISEDGNLLIFASNPEEGFGGYDLYYSIKIDGTDTEWSEPINMGNSINTKGNDVFPFMDKDTLYFSSDGHVGMGGLDIFRVEKKAQRWQRPQNLKAPINSGGDDFGFIIDREGNRQEGIEQIGYFASNRIGGKGSDDIYRFAKEPIIEPVVPQQDTPQIVFVINLEGLAKERLLAEPTNPNSTVTGYQNLMGVSIQISSEDTVYTVGSDIDGSFYGTLKADRDYSLKATKQGYFTETATLSTKGIVLTESNPDTTLKVEMALTKIITNQEIVLENIYYDLDKADIREDAKPTLDSLVLLLQTNPTLNIQLSSHTDCQGQTSYNERLSQRRAESAVQYLIQKEINADRLTAKGYGESKLADDCKCNECTPEQHQTNRRTTFLILE
jgi:outer membrane protein OmpA-like peptidoglycan-associated protein/tetratricopeptide (TPR) repeat protein